MDPRNIKCRQPLKQNEIKEDGSDEGDEDSDNDMEIVEVQASSRGRSGRLIHRGNVVDKETALDRELQACGIDTKDMADDEKEQMIQVLRMSKQQAAQEEKYRGHVRDQNETVTGCQSVTNMVSQSVEDDRSELEQGQTQSVKKELQTSRGKRSSRKCMQFSESNQNDETERKTSRRASPPAKKKIEVRKSAVTSAKKIQKNEASSQEKSVLRNDDNDDDTQLVDMEELSPELFSTQQSMEIDQTIAEGKLVSESDDETLPPSPCFGEMENDVTTSETQTVSSQEDALNRNNTRLQPRKRKLDDADLNTAAKISRRNESARTSPDLSKESSGESQDTPTPSPMILNLVNFKNLRRKLLYKGPPYFAPAGADQVAYTKVIVQLFDQYRVILKETQDELTEELSWGKPVEVGRHMENTIGLYKRGGEKNLNFDMEEERYEQDAGGRIETKEPKRIKNSDPRFESSQRRQDTGVCDIGNETKIATNVDRKWTYKDNYEFPDEASSKVNQHQTFVRKSRKPKITIDTEDDLPDILNDDSNEDQMVQSSHLDAFPSPDANEKDRMFSKLGFDDLENPSNIPATDQERVGRMDMKKTVSQKKSSVKSLRLLRSRSSTKRSKMPVVEESAPQSISGDEEDFNDHSAKKSKHEDIDKPGDMPLDMPSDKTLDADGNYDDYFADELQTVVTSTQIPDQTTRSDSPIFSGNSNDFSLGVSISKQFPALFDSSIEERKNVSIIKPSLSPLKSEDLYIPEEDTSYLKRQKKGMALREKQMNKEDEVVKDSPSTSHVHSQIDGQYHRDDNYSQKTPKIQEHLFPCPVCGAHFPQDRIEQHVHRCLDGQEETPEEREEVMEVESESAQLSVKREGNTYLKIGKRRDKAPLKYDQDELIQDSGSDEDWLNGKEAKEMKKDDDNSSESSEAEGTPEPKNKKRIDLVMQTDEKKMKNREPMLPCIICSAQVPQSQFEDHVGHCVDEQERGHVEAPEPRMTRQASPRLAQRKGKRGHKVKGEDIAEKGEQSTGQWLSTDKNDNDFEETKRLSSGKKRQS